MERKDSKRGVQARDARCRRRDHAGGKIYCPDKSAATRQLFLLRYVRSWHIVARSGNSPVPGLTGGSGAARMFVSVKMFFLFFWGVLMKFRFARWNRIALAIAGTVLAAPLLA